MNRSKSGVLAVVLLFTLGHRGAVAETIGTGDPAGPMTFTDIDGHSVSMGDYADWVQVWTFGDRNSADRLTEWMGPAGVRAMTDHPELRFAFLGFADVSEVPTWLQSVSLAVMRHINDSAQANLRETYARRGVDATPARTRFHLTADWDGDYLRAFDIPDAKRYHCWIIHGGRVVAHLVEGTPDLAHRFASAIAGLDAGPTPQAQP